MHSKRLSAFAATILSVAAFAAFNPPQYTNTYTSGGVTYAQFGGVKSSNYVATAVSFGEASNYVDAVASEFEDGTRTVSRAISAGDASTAVSSYYLAGDSWSKQYNADDLIRASTNAALSVSGTLEGRLTNGYLKVASAESADEANTADTAQNAANVAWDANGNYMSGSEIYARVVEDMPRPGNYAAVSNAAMNARSATDLGVRGAPQGEGSYFIVNGESVTWVGGHEDPADDGWYGNVHISPIAGGYYEISTGHGYTNFMLQGEGYAVTLNVYGETYHVQGFSGSLAQVSQIPVVPSGIVTTNANGELLIQGTNVFPLVFGAAQRTEISATDPTFSNAVLSVGLNIDTNAVAAINALVEQGEELPIGGAAGVGALLVAIAAAVAALKRRVTSAETALAQKANTSDLPYRLVEPGEWEFSGVPSSVTDISLSWDGVIWEYAYVIGTDIFEGALPIGYDGTELSLTFTITDDVTVTATRASLPGHLLDRAGNRVVVSGDTTLTLPAAVPGYLRDFLVRLEISGSTVPTITFAAPTGETITYETDGDEFPVPDEAGTWSYSFTENCVAHTFAVSLKKVNEVAAPQAQGGS